MKFKIHFMELEWHHRVGPACKDDFDNNNWYLILYQYDTRLHQGNKDPHLSFLALSWGNATLHLKFCKIQHKTTNYL